MIPGPRAVRLSAGTMLIVLAAVAAVHAAAWQVGTGWLQTVFLWAAIALLTWGLLQEG